MDEFKLRQELVDHLVSHWIRFDSHLGVPWLDYERSCGAELIRSFVNLEELVILLERHWTNAFLAKFTNFMYSRLVFLVQFQGDFIHLALLVVGHLAVDYD